MSKKSLGTAIAIAIATFLGNGVYWQWQSSRLSAKQHHLRVLEERSAVYQRLSDEFDKYKAFASCRPEDKFEAQRLTTNISFLKSRFQALEAEAAKLEARAPRDIEPDFVPAPCPATDPRWGTPILR
jgi:hypothetical protein